MSRASARSRRSRRSRRRDGASIPVATWAPEVEEIDDEVFEEQLAESHAELRALGARARELEDAVDGVLEQLLSEST